MKRVVVLILAMFMFGTIAYAAGNPVMLNADEGIKIVATDAMFDHSELFDDYKLKFDITITNNSKKDYTLVCSKAYINGWEVETVGYIDITAGMKKKDTISIDLKDVEMLTADSIKDLKEIKVNFRYYPTDNFMSSKSVTKKINADWVKKKVLHNKKTK